MLTGTCVCVCVWVCVGVGVGEGCVLNSMVCTRTCREVFLELGFLNLHTCI